MRCPAAIEEPHRTCLRAHGALLGSERHLHDHSDLQLVEISADDRVAREVEFRRIVDLDEPVVLLGKKPDDHATLTGIFVWLGVIVPDVGHLLQLPFDGVEGIVEGGGLILLCFTPLFRGPADHPPSARHLHLNGHGDRDLCSLRLAIRHLDDDPAADHARIKGLEVIDAVPDQRFERRRGTHALESDLQWTLHVRVTVCFRRSHLWLATSRINVRSGSAFRATDRALASAQGSARTTSAPRAPGSWSTRVCWATLA